MVIGPAVERCGIVPVGHFFKLLKKPLFLELFAFENIYRRTRSSAVSSMNEVHERDWGLFKIALFFRSALPTIRLSRPENT